MFGKINPQEEVLHKKITERKPNEFLLKQINKTPERLNDILWNQKKIEIENRKLKNQEKKWLEYKWNAMVEEILNEFSTWVKKNNSWTYSKEFIERFNELINQDFESVYGLIKFIIATWHQVSFFNDFLVKNLNNFPEKTQLRILNEIWTPNSSYSHLIDEIMMRHFYQDVGNTTKCEQIAYKLARNKDEYVREQVMYNKNLKKDFMLNEVILRLTDDKNEFVREVAFEIRDKLQWKHNFVN